MRTFADEVIDDIKLMMVQYGQVVIQIQTPHEVAYNACLKTLRKSNFGMTIEEMCQLAIEKEQNQQVANYPGYIWNMEHNIKLRQVVKSLLNHPCVKKTNSHPIVLQWLADTADTADIEKEKNNSVGDQNG